MDVWVPKTVDFNWAILPPQGTGLYPETFVVVGVLLALGWWGASDAALYLEVSRMTPHRD